MKRGLFITVEGTDGSGKTTQIDFIREYLQARGYEVVITREPGGTRISEIIRSVILNPDFTEMGNNTEMLLYAAARAQLVAEIIKPSLEQGKTVICDRFLDSSYAYQGFGRGINLENIEKVNNIAIDGVMPEITFFFDLDPEIALKRRMASSSADRIENEKIEFHKRVHAGFVDLANRYPGRIRTIDASRRVDDIRADVKAILDSLLEI